MCLQRRFVSAGVLLALYLGGFLYLVVAGDRREARYYTASGIPQSESVARIRTFLPLPLLVFCGISIAAESFGVFPAALRVPVSAVYVCPLLIFANWRWAKGSFVGYLWAGLYGVWAFAILLHVPVLTFSEGGSRLLRPGAEMYLAVPVTGLLTGLIAYAYSRWMLRKLKGVVRCEEQENSGH